MKIIYVAGPYTHPSPLVREIRYRMLTRYAAHLLWHNVVYSPITHGHQLEAIVPCGYPRGWDFWASRCLPLLRASDELHVLTLLGWSLSVGVSAELREAARLDLPVRYVDPMTWGF